jgi:hypothetical protein
MIGDIRKLRAEKPFVPFTIHLGDGSALRVPTFDHISQCTATVDQPSED